MSTVLPLSFTSQTGTQFPRSGVTFSLPPVTGQPFQVIGHVNHGGNAYQDIEEADGVYITSGTSSLYRSQGEVTGTFDLFTGWLRTNANKNYFTGVTDDRAATLNAVIDFIQIVVQGGLGTFTVATPPGSTYTGYTATAVIDGDYTIAYQNGSTRATVQATFIIPSGNWTATPGNIIIPVH